MRAPSLTLTKDWRYPKYIQKSSPNGGPTSGARLTLRCLNWTFDLESVRTNTPNSVGCPNPLNQTSWIISLWGGVWKVEDVRLTNLQKKLIYKRDYAISIWV